MFTLPSGKVIYPNSENLKIPQNFCLTDQRPKYPHLTARAVLNNNGQDWNIRCNVFTTPHRKGFRAKVDFGYLSVTGEVYECKKEAVNAACEQMIALLIEKFKYVIEQ